jgi:glutaredoxin
MVLARYLYLILRFSGKNNYKQGWALSSTGGTRLSSKAQVIVYSKPGCHLCDEAKEAIRSAGCDERFTLTEINIESDPVLMAKYRYDIPVIAINGVETFTHRVDPREFRAKILSTG